LITGSKVDRQPGSRREEEIVESPLDSGQGKNDSRILEGPRRSSRVLSGGVLEDSEVLLVAVVDLDTRA
jgi:hypothetical protein